MTREFGVKPKLKDDEKGKDVDHVCKDHEQVLAVGVKCEFCGTVMG